MDGQRYAHTYARTDIWPRNSSVKLNYRSALIKHSRPMQLRFVVNKRLMIWNIICKWHPFTTICKFQHACWLVNDGCCTLCGRPIRRLLAHRCWITSRIRCFCPLYVVSIEILSAGYPIIRMYINIATAYSASAKFYNKHFTFLSTVSHQKKHKTYHRQTGRGSNKTRNETRRQDFNAPASTCPAVILTFDLQNLARWSLGASEYSL